MKKFLAILAVMICLVAAFALTACSKNDDAAETSTTENEPVVEDVVEDEAAVEDETAAEDEVAADDEAAAEDEVAAEEDAPAA
jgi:ABC-type oligopeptide transport system substrate-binding subunit